MNLEILDQSLTLAINSWNSVWSDPIWVFFSKIKVWFPMYAIIAGLLIWRLGWKKGLVAVITLALTITCVDQFCNLIKDWTVRLRPCNDPLIVAQGLHILEAPHPNYQYGFFSGHSANAFAFALGSVLMFRLDPALCSYTDGKTKVSPLMRAYTIFIMVWALMVAFSRIFVGKHFLGDIFVGAFVGMLIAYILYLVATYLTRRYIK